MTPDDHVNYAKHALRSLAQNPSTTAVVDFVPDSSKSRNAAWAMTAILCNRLANVSRHQPVHKKDKTYEWDEGVFICRNIADRDHFWTNLRRSVADEMHEATTAKAAAYVFAFSDPADHKIGVWSLPESLIYDSLPGLPPKRSNGVYSLEISPRNQRIEHYAASPDLRQYFNEFPMAAHELQLLNKSREVDALVKQQKRLAGKNGNSISKRVAAIQSELRRSLKRKSLELSTTEGFDPTGINDARERVFSSIVRRRGQPKFRRRLLRAYNFRCAITSCDIEAILEAAHIIPYRGRKTNHPANGLLLRADMHTLFDLKLLTVDTTSMTVLLSPLLQGTCYEQYNGQRINIPVDPVCQPSPEALNQHRSESGL